MGRYKAELITILSGAGATRENRWSFVDFYNKVLFTNRSVQARYWGGSGAATVIPGLPTNARYDGVTSFAGHVVFWRDDILTWSDVNDFSTYIPVGLTAVYQRLTLVETFTQTVAGVTTGWVFVDKKVNLVAGQYVRIDASDFSKSSFFSVAKVAPSTGNAFKVVEFDTTVLANLETKVWLAESPDWATGTLLKSSTDGLFEVVKVGKSYTTQFSPAEGTAATLPDVGSTFSFNTTFDTGIKAGAYFSLSSGTALGQDIYEVVAAAGPTLSLRRLGIGSDRLASGSVIGAGNVFTEQPWVSVISVSAAVIAARTTLTPKNALKLTLQDLTGAHATGYVHAIGAEIVALPANEAGTVQNAGDKINGAVLNVIPFSDYGYIFKEKSIQSVQYVGKASGTFNIRTEVQDEGPICKHALCRFDTNAVVFLGNRGGYVYKGGTNLLTLDRNAVDPALKELDRSRLNDIVAFHRRSTQEVWFKYYAKRSDKPRVLIYSYQFNTTTLDDYDESLGDLTSLEETSWELAPIWDEILSEVQWGTVDGKTWNDYVEDGELPLTIMGTRASAANESRGETGTQPRLMAYGYVYHRASVDDCDPSAIRSVYESGDFDFGKPDHWKYGHTFQPHFNVVSEQDQPAYVYVQFGGRDTFDGDIRWTDPVRYEVSGNGQPSAKASLRQSGRFMRVRVYSEHPGVQWRLTGYEMHARVGGTF